MVRSQADNMMIFLLSIASCPFDDTAGSFRHLITHFIKRDDVTTLQTVKLAALAHACKQADSNIEVKLVGITNDTSTAYVDKFTAFEKESDSIIKSSKNLKELFEKLKNTADGITEDADAFNDFMLIKRSIPDPSLHPPNAAMEFVKSQWEFRDFDCVRMQLDLYKTHNDLFKRFSPFASDIYKDIISN